MNRPREHDRDDGASIDEREWALQEQALDDERRGLPALGDVRRLRYRVLARGLRALPEPALPSNFARETAGAVERRAREEARAFARFRRRLYAAFALVYAACFLLAITLSGVDAVVPLGGAHADASSMRWLLALLACLGAPPLLGVARAPRR
ncbi:MAG TPA: hypothetical protein VFS55_04145 [Dokdonella sp.]|nr:hypothetical protein [Dokdonella sp.]